MTRSKIKKLFVHQGSQWFEVLRTMNEWLHGTLNKIGFDDCLRWRLAGFSHFQSRLHLLVRMAVDLMVSLQMRLPVLLVWFKLVRLCTWHKSTMIQPSLKRRKTSELHLHAMSIITSFPLMATMTNTKMNEQAGQNFKMLWDRTDNMNVIIIK